MGAPEEVSRLKKLPVSLESHNSVIKMTCAAVLDLGKRRCGECSQVAAAPPDGVVAARRTHVKQAFPLGRLTDHAQLPVFVLPNKHLQQVDTTGRLHIWRTGGTSGMGGTLTSQ